MIGSFYQSDTGKTNDQEIMKNNGGERDDNS